MENSAYMMRSGHGRLHRAEVTELEAVFSTALGSVTPDPGVMDPSSNVGCAGTSCMSGSGLRSGQQLCSMGGPGIARERAFKRFIYAYCFSYVDVLPPCVYVHHVCACRAWHPGSSGCRGS